MAFGTSVADAQEGRDALVARIQALPSTDTSVGVTITLDASGSTSGIPSAHVVEVRYTWDLGDSTTQVGERIAHAYADSGAYRVVLTMDVFENTGVYHRATATAIVNILPAEAEQQAAAFDLSSSFTSDTASQTPALIWIQPQMGAGPIDSAEPPAAGTAPTDLLSPFVVSGGSVALGRVSLWNASCGVDVLDGAAVLFVGVGRNIGSVDVSLTSSFPQVDEAGGELFAELDSVTLYSLGIGFRVSAPMYVVADMVCLAVEGAYTGSTRVTIDGRPLPVRFSGAVASFDVGIGFRFGWLMLSAKLLFLI